MSRLVLAALVLGSFSSLACSSAPEAPPALGAAADGGAAPAPSPPPGNVAPGDAGRPSEPPAPPPKADEVTEQFGVFVAPSGAAGNPGSRSAPLASIAEALEQAVAAKKARVFVCEGTYAESLELANGVSIVGGLDCSTPTWKLTDRRSKLESPVSPAIRAANITTATRLDNLDVVAPSATVASGSSVGLLAIDANALTFAKGSIRAGDGMKGDDGVEGAQLAHVLGYGPEVGQMPALAPAGATNDLAGGLGKDGVCNLPDGAAFARTGGGKGGSSGIWSKNAAGVWTALPQNLPSLPGPVLGTGAAGTAGTSGAEGALTDEGYAPSDGTAGTNGDVGRGGVGGAGKAPPADMFAMGRTYGESGAGGGSGGCPGLAGTAGKGGGASLAAALVRSPVRFDGMVLQAGNGGAGGRGTFGSEPTQGTPGANDGSVLVIDATKSSPGGAGGAAGVSGHGAGGPSIAIAHAGLAPIVAPSTTTKFGAGGAGLPASSRGARTIPAAAPGVAVGVKAY